MIPEGKLNYIQGSPLAVSVINARRFPAHVHSSALELIFCLQGSATVVTAHQHLSLIHISYWIFPFSYEKQPCSCDGSKDTADPGNLYHQPEIALQS